MWQARWRMCSVRAARLAVGSNDVVAMGANIAQQ
jgi:hypothetical protein